MTPADKETQKWDAFEKQARARAALPRSEQEIYYFLMAYWNSLGSLFNPDRDEQPAFREAARRFGVSVEEAKKVWRKVDGAGLELS
jgi:hypothetical protein